MNGITPGMQALGMTRLPTVSELKQYAVNRPDQFEITRQSLYDTQAYAAAGQTILTFFQDPIGQSGKTKADTNIESAGQLPAPKYFLVDKIELLVFPGENPVTSVATPSAAADGPSNFTNDMYTLVQSGYLDFFIGSKSYLTEAPIGRFPPQTSLDADFAVSTDAGATAFSITMDYSTFKGRPYYIDPQITLIPNQNFNVTLNWPTVVPLPSGNNASIKCILDGLLYRLSQ